MELVVTVDFYSREEALSALMERHLHGLMVMGDRAEALRLSLLRQAALRMAPASRRSLVAAVLGGMRELDDNALGSAEVDRELDSLIAAGDLLYERSEVSDGAQWLVYPSPPVFVRRSETTAFVLGAIPDDDILRSTMRLAGPYRQLTPAPTDGQLLDLGLTQIPLDKWLTHPTTDAAESVIRRIRQELDSAGRAGDMRDLEILDPTKDRHYYKGRFTAPAHGHTGTFLGRRGRRWGGSRWVCVELATGVPQRYVDLPVLDPRFGGLDEARWLICAFDAAAGTPQRARVQRALDPAVVSFDSPLPGWAERRILTVGEASATRARGALMAIVLDVDVLEQELDFLQHSLWMEVVFD
jgi:hypothetical protein